MQGQIVRINGNNYYLEYQHQIQICSCPGKLKKMRDFPVVGDNVLFDLEKKTITKILPRTNLLIRPRVSNLDQALIITSLKAPDFSTNLLDKLLVILEFNRVKSIICLSKEDLLTKNEKQELDKIISYYEKIGYLVISNTDLLTIKKLLKKKLTVFIGQTGSGKSTLLNKINPDLNLRTNEVSLVLGRGRHTTTNIELFELAEGKVLDTPGFSAIDFIGMTNEDIKNNFIEFRKYNCTFRDCDHLNEKDCLIKKLVENGTILKSRYENYLKFIRR